MNLPGAKRSGELAAILVTPNREMAGRFCETIPEARCFQILADLKKYPPESVLELRIRQLKPDVVLLDLASDLETAANLIRCVVSMRPAVPVIGLHVASDPETMVRALRLGASDFLCAPFDAAVQREAVAGILRLRQPEPPAEADPGRIVAFSSAKPGSGATVLACHFALALQRATGQQVLLADLDFAGGTAAFYLQARSPHSFLDVVERAERLDPGTWASLAVDCRGVDVLPAPAVPRDIAPDAGQFRQALEQARRFYEWTILDLPAIFHRTSLLALAESDRTFLVTTPELPSLHLARKAAALLGQLGVGKERMQVLVNRTEKGGGMSDSDLERVLNSPVERCFPNDSVSLHRAVAAGEPLSGNCGLGKAIEDSAARLAGLVKAESRANRLMPGADPILAGT